MQDETTPQGSAAMPPASVGSAGEPLAYAVMQPDSYVVVHTLHTAGVVRESCAGGDIIPLYRHPQPTLTEAEREAITEASDFYVGTRTGVTLRGLLERMRR